MCWGEGGLEVLADNACMSSTKFYYWQCMNSITCTCIDLEGVEEPF